MEVKLKGEGGNHLTWMLRKGYTWSGIHKAMEAVGKQDKEKKEEREKRACLVPCLCTAGSPPCEACAHWGVIQREQCLRLPDNFMSAITGWRVQCLNLFSWNSGCNIAGPRPPPQQYYVGLVCDLPPQQSILLRTGVRRGEMRSVHRCWQSWRSEWLRLLFKVFSSPRNGCILSVVFWVILGVNLLPLHIFISSIHFATEFVL